MTATPTTTTTVTPFLMFQGDCEAALTLYAATIPGCEITLITRWDDSGQGPEGKVQMATFRIGETTVMAFDSPPVHDFTFTPAASLWLNCASADDYETILAGLGEEGRFLMPDDTYGFSPRYAWLTDRYGVSWQVNLP